MRFKKQEVCVLILFHVGALHPPTNQWLSSCTATLFYSLRLHFFLKQGLFIRFPLRSSPETR